MKRRIVLAIVTALIIMVAASETTLEYKTGEPSGQKPVAGAVIANALGHTNRAGGATCRH
jgi:hypothetical protein